MEFPRFRTCNFAEQSRARTREKKNGKFILSLVDDVYKHTIIRCVDRDVTVLLLLTNSSKRNISVLRGSIATHVDKNTKSTNNKLATMTSK